MSLVPALSKKYLSLAVFLTTNIKYSESLYLLLKKELTVLKNITNLFLLKYKLRIFIKLQKRSNKQSYRQFKRQNKQPTVFKHFFAQKQDDIQIVSVDKGKEATIT